MGVKKKEHRKKVAARNQKLKTQKDAMQKMFDGVMKKQLEELQKQYENAKSGPQESSIDGLEVQKENIKPTE